MFFPVGTDRPARRRPAALDLPILSRPFQGRLGWSFTAEPLQFYFVSLCTHCTCPSLFVAGHRRSSSLSFARICAVCVPCISPARVLHTTRSTVPPGPAWYHPPSRRWRGGSDASRRSLVPRPPGPPASGRVPLPALHDLASFTMPSSLCSASLLAAPASVEGRLGPDSGPCISEPVSRYL